MSEQVKMSLTDSLKPIWLSTYGAGVLPDWCKEFQRRLCSRIANGIGIASTLIIVTFVGAFQLWQLISQIKVMVNIHSVVTNVLWFYGYPVSIMVHLHYMIHRSRYLDFFSRWNKLERRYLMRGHFPAKNWGLRCLIGVHLILIIISTLVTGVLIFAGPETSILMKTCKILRDIFTVPVIGVIQTISYGQCRIVGLLCDIVPGTVFYHAALTVRSLEEELHLKFALLKLTRTPSIDQKRQICLKKELNDWWSHYINLKRSVCRANDLFGLVIALNDGLLFSVICCVTYSFLYNLKTGDPWQLVTMFFCMSVNTFRLVSSTLLASKLQRSSRQLSAAFTALSCRNWQLLNEHEERMVEMIMNHLRDEPLCARPWDLYDLNYTFLLKVLSIAATYVVILLQSK
jgi:7tm Chemosensory receptor